MNCNTSNLWHAAMYLFLPPKPMVYLSHIHSGLLSKLPGAINHHRWDSCSHESGQYKPPSLLAEQGFGLAKPGTQKKEMGTPRSLQLQSLSHSSGQKSCFLLISQNKRIIKSASEIWLLRFYTGIKNIMVVSQDKLLSLKPLLKPL